MSFPTWQERNRKREKENKVLVYESEKFINGWVRSRPKSKKNIEHAFSERSNASFLGRLWKDIAWAKCM